MEGVLSSRLLRLSLSISQIAVSACLFAGYPQLPDGAKVIRDLSYVTMGHERQKLDLYLPRTLKGALVVWIHGGGWQSQTKADVEVLQLLTLGYTVAQSAVAKLLGGPIDEKVNLARRASPVTWVKKEAAPLYILHGTKDPFIPLGQSQKLADKLKAAGAEVTLDVVEGGGHGDKGFWRWDRSKRLAEFLDRHLRKP